jgi:hypothetical protein
VQTPCWLFCGLRGCERRGPTTDNDPAAIRAEQLALDDALQGGVAFDAIETAAKAFAAAYDPENNGRRFLQPLSKWLSARGWEQPPPNRKKRGNGNGHWPRHKRKPSGSDAFLKTVNLEETADGVIRQRRTH